MNVDVEGIGSPGIPCVTKNPKAFVHNGNQMNDRIHAYGAKIFLQMTANAGRSTMPVSYTQLDVYKRQGRTLVPIRFMDLTAPTPLSRERVRRTAVSYTHLDVYKRQGYGHGSGRSCMGHSDRSGGIGSLGGWISDILPLGNPPEKVQSDTRCV